MNDLRIIVKDWQTGFFLKDRTTWDCIDQGNRSNRMDHWPLTHMIMKTTFHSPPSASSRTSKDSGIIQLESKVLRTMGTNGVSSSWRPKAKNQETDGIHVSPHLKVKNQEHQRPMAGEDGCPSWSREQTCPPSPFLFHSGSQMAGWHLPTLVRAIFN